MLAVEILVADIITVKIVAYASLSETKLIDCIKQKEGEK